MKFKPIEAEDLPKLEPYYERRPNKTCDSMPMDSFLWKDLYDVRFAISDDKAVQWLLKVNGVTCAAMPDCSTEDLPHYFYEMVDYFRDELKLPFIISLADEEAVEELHLKESPLFTVEEKTDFRDYLYSGDALRSLSGKKLHKKKNHLNSFLNAYEGRYEYRRLDYKNRDEVLTFLDEWREQKGEEADKNLDYEVRGIHSVLRNCDIVPVRMAGVYIDGKLKAFTIGSYNAYENMAIIHIEKADAEIRGLYQFINQQFLINEFPDAALVNREDDMGNPGLRHAKESYNPVGFARKYCVKLDESHSEL